MFNATPLLRLYARYRQSKLARQNPVATQARELQKLLKKASNTQFGKDHGFSQVQSVQDFQKAVPLRNYEKMWEEYFKPHFPLLENVSWPGKIPYFAVSSGTSSGSTKYIPLTKEMLRSNTQAGLDLLTFHVTGRPHSQIFGGLNFMLGGSTDFEKVAPGVFSGDLSGITVTELPFWAKPRYFPPQELAHEKDWEKKIAVFVEEIPKRDIRMLGGVPAWILILVEKLRQVHGKPDGVLKDFFPNLEMLVHGGVNFAPYLAQFKDLLQGSHAELREVYPASEGFIATADRGSGEGMRMHLDTGIFYEFVPLEELESDTPTRHWMANVEKDVNYAIVMTTCAGLFSYVIGDTVRFVDTETPRLLVTGRTSYYMSAFGEHLIAEEVEDAISRAATTLGVNIVDYSMGAIFPDKTSELGRHRFYVEIEGGLLTEEQQQTMSQVIDERLTKRNEDYAAHRAEGFGLGSPEIVSVSEGFFAAWMKSRGKLGGQNKVPRLISKDELFNNLKAFAAEHEVQNKQQENVVG